ncbi:MAG: cytochrome D1 domain-containing protein, partial [Cyclobacteriaceae bacterium]
KLAHPGVPETGDSGETVSLKSLGSLRSSGDMEGLNKKSVGQRRWKVVILLIFTLLAVCMAGILNAQNIIKEPTLLVANKHSNTLSFVNPKTLKVIETIPTGPNPHEITVTPDHRFAYLSSYAPPGNTISLVDLVKRKLIKEIPTGSYTRIHGAAMAPDGKHAYFTAGQTGYVVEVDTKTNEVTRGIPTHGKISHTVYVSPDGKRLYTANIVSENISVIDRSSGELITQIKAGEGCEGMAFTPDAKHLWAANQTGGTITIIDVATHKPIETFVCPGMPVRIRFTEDGKLALVPSWTKTGELIVIDVATHKELKRIKVGSFAIGVELSPDGKRAFVGCEDSMEAEILPDGSERIKHDTGDSDGVHVINMKTLSVESVIKTGLGPDPMVMIGDQ